jgi:prepilin-type N-terminal cleavage/methylation domain-containing protein
MTLIEVMIVLALLGLAAAVSVPAFSSALAPRSDVEQVAADLAQLAARARATALARGVPVTLTVDPATARWWLDVPETTGVFMLPIGVTLASAEARARLAFAPTGPAEAEPIAVRADEQTIDVLIDRWTGEVRTHAR